MTSAIEQTRIDNWRDGHDWYRRMYESQQALLEELLKTCGIWLDGHSASRSDLVEAGLLDDPIRSASHTTQESA